MKKIIILSIILFFPVNCIAGTIKNADLAGSWYPASSKALSTALDSYLDLAKVEPIKDNIKAIIAPHAGLIYSGPVAAYVYKAVQKKEYNTVIVLGFSHRRSFDGVSVYKEGYFQTPIGALEIDSQLASEIISCHKKIFFNPAAFDNENSIELQLPFIKKVLPNSRIVPIAFGSSDFNYCKIVADILADILSKREDVLLAVSTDMSHFHTYKDARDIDLRSIELLKNFAAKDIYERSIIGEQLFCGYMPVATALLACKNIGADNIEILQYANSGDVTGDKSRVVGYVSAAIYKKVHMEKAKHKGVEMLNQDQRKKLLKIARDAIRTYLQTGKILEVYEDVPVLNREMGAFVTLHKKGQLRGCIGNIIGKGPLYLTVRDTAIESATGDSRFSRVTLKELDEIDIEISVLSELEKIADVEEIEMGVHGVVVRKGFASGVFLPQVATETGWTREEFLTNLCAHKAGLFPDAWKTGDIDIYIFTAEVFGEKD